MLSLVAMNELNAKQKLPHFFKKLESDLFIDLIRASHYKRVLSKRLEIAYATEFNDSPFGRSIFIELI